MAGQSGLGQPGDHFRPGISKIGAVVPTATECQHPAVAQARGQLHQVLRRAPVHGRTEAQVGDRITLDAVGAALEHQELRFEALDVLQDPGPGGAEGAIA